MSTRSSEAGWNWQTTLFWASHSFQNTPKQSEFEQIDYLINGKRMKVLPLFQKKRDHKTIKMEQAQKNRTWMERCFLLKRDVMKANLRSRWWSSLSLSKSCCFALHNSNCCERPCRRGMSPTRWAWQATKSFLVMTHDCQEQDGGDGGHLDRSHLELLQLLLAETRLLHDLVHALLWSRWLEMVLKIWR